MTKKNFEILVRRSIFSEIVLFFKKKVFTRDQSQISFLSSQNRGRRCRLEGHPRRSDTNRTGAEDSSFYYSRLLYCLDQMLAVMLLSQHRVSLFKTVRPCAQCGARCIGHAIRTWSAVCSEASHWQFGEGARLQLK